MMASSRDAKRRRIEGESIDWIIDLPANVIDNIMQRLPLRDAAKVGVLSRKSRQIWMSLPCLTFDARFFKDVLKNKQLQVYEFYSIVSKILLSHNGPIHRFFLHIPNMNSTSSPEIGHLITFLSNNGVHQITLENYNRLILKLPSQLFTCAKLEILKLCYCTFSIPPTFKSFENLTRLDLVKVRFVGETFGSFISSLKVLRILILRGLSGVDHLALNAPNLEYIEAYGKFKSICLKGCVGLSYVTIGVVEKVAKDDATTRELIATTARDLVEFLTGASKVRKLCLGAYSFEFLAGPRFWGLLLKPFKRLKSLRLSNINISVGKFSCLCAVSLLESCPNLEGLTISFASTNLESKAKVTSDFFGDMFLHLRSMYFLNVTGLGVELSLIASLLCASPVLETLYIQRSIRSTSSTFPSWSPSWFLKAPRTARFVLLPPEVRI